MRFCSVNLTSDLISRFPFPVIDTRAEGLVVGVPSLTGDGLLGRVFGLTGDGLVGRALGLTGDRVFLSSLIGDRVLGLTGDCFPISCLRFATRSSYFSVLRSNLEIDRDILLFLDLDLASSSSFTVGVLDLVLGCVFVILLLDLDRETFSFFTVSVRDLGLDRSFLILLLDLDLDSFSFFQ